MERRDFENWVERYVAAWRAPGTAALQGLFTPEATYSTAPYEPPFEGLERIAEMWERERQGPEEAFALRSRVVAVDGETGVIRLDVDYGEPVVQSYRDIWIVVLGADGRCRSFEEWPFWPPGSKGEWPTSAPPSG